ncbi:MAG: GSCFA domain-containing protein [Marinilabiliaceae bacterium]
MANPMPQFRWSTPVLTGSSRVGISFSRPMLILGSCFADNIGRRMSEVGFDALVNPLGTMYNPLSIADSLRRIGRCEQFTAADCVPIGAGDGRICSFSHHTRHARATQSDFLDSANKSLRDAHCHWLRTSTLIITLGTAWCFRHLASGKVVGNCLKHVPSEFARFRLTLAECVSALNDIVSLAAGRDIVFTVSPIRHMADGAHGNQLSKSTLLLAADNVMANHENVDYFPSYEIILDELRDYRFYADDMTHPTSLAEDYVFNRFMEFALSPAEFPRLQEGFKQARRAAHRQMS